MSSLKYMKLLAISHLSSTFNGSKSKRMLNPGRGSLKSHAQSTLWGYSGKPGDSIMPVRSVMKAPQFGYGNSSGNWGPALSPSGQMVTLGGGTSIVRERKYKVKYMSL